MQLKRPIVIGRVVGERTVQTESWIELIPLIIPFPILKAYWELVLYPLRRSDNETGSLRTTPGQPSKPQTHRSDNRIRLILFDQIVLLFDLEKLTLFLYSFPAVIIMSPRIKNSILKIQLEKDKKKTVLQSSFIIAFSILHSAWILHVWLSILRSLLTGTMFFEKVFWNTLELEFMHGFGYGIWQ